MRRPLIIAAIVGTATILGGAVAGHAQSPGKHVSASLIGETRKAA
jgi:hypothetical protein